jgi:hypothetical protein
MSYETAAFRASPSLSKILSFQRGGDPPNRCDQVRPDRYTASILRVLRPARGGDCSVHIEKGLCRDTRYSLATTLRHGERACPFSPVFLGQDLRMLLSAARILKSVSTVLRNGEAAHRRCRPLPVCMHRQRKERAPTHTRIATMAAAEAGSCGRIQNTSRLASEDLQRGCSTRRVRQHHARFGKSAPTAEGVELDQPLASPVDRERSEHGVDASEHVRLGVATDGAGNCPAPSGLDLGERLAGVEPAYEPSVCREGAPVCRAA